MDDAKAAIPEDMCSDIYEDSTEAGAGRLPKGWSRWFDTEAGAWDATTYTHNGDTVMLPGSSDLAPMLRRDVEDLYGQLVTEEQHDGYCAVMNAKMALEHAKREAAEAETARSVEPDNAQTTEPADTLPEWLHNRYSRYQPGMPPWAQLGDGDRDYWAHEAAAVRRAVVRGGFRIDPTEQLPDGTPLSWEQRARKAEYTIERMKRTNRMVNGGARAARERAEAAEQERDRLAALVPAEPAGLRAAALREGADAIDTETMQAKAHGVLEPDAYRPCRDASAQLRTMACPTPETHNWGCGCPTDELPAHAERERRAAADVAAEFDGEVLR